MFNISCRGGKYNSLCSHSTTWVRWLTVWSIKSTSVYMVCSGYKLLLRGYPMIREDGYVTISPKFWNIYKQLWLFLAPTKTKITLWKFLNNFVPTRSNLYVKWLANDMACYRCMQVPKCVFHVCRYCWVATKIWNKLGFS